MDDADADVALADVDVPHLLVGQLFGDGLLHVLLDLRLRDVGRRTHRAGRLRILRHHACEWPCAHRQRQDDLPHAPSTSRSIARLEASRSVASSNLALRITPRQREREVLAAVHSAADGDDDVLPAIHGVRHRRPRLLRRHVDTRRLPCRSSCRRRAAWRRAGDWARRRQRIAGDDQRLRHQRADRARLTRARNRQSLQRADDCDAVRRLAVRHLPDELAAIEIDRA